MANRRCFQTLTRQLYNPKPSSSLHHLRTLAKIPNLPQKSIHHTFSTPNLNSSLTHFTTYCHLSSDRYDNTEETEENGGYDDDDEMGDDAANSVSKREYSPEEREIVAAAIGYKVIGQLQQSDRVFNSYGAVFAVIQIGAHQFKVSNGDCAHTENLKFNKILHERSLTTNLTPFLIRRMISTAADDAPKSPTISIAPPSPSPLHGSNLRTRTPLEKQFESWLEKLKPGFTSCDVEEALRAQSDPDLAFDIFRWTGQQRGYKHNSTTYLTMIHIAVSGKRYQHAETLVEEVVAGACSGSVPLYNSIIKFCCGRKFLFNRAFDVYKKMLNCDDTKPNLETYKLLLDSLLRRFNNVHVCYVYMRGVKSLAKQMKASGVIPDTFAQNMIIKAHAKCHQLDEAIRVFREMGLYGNEPNAYTYCYLIHGLCEKGRVDEGLGFYKEMKLKGLVPKGSTYMILICSLAMEQRFADSIGVTFDMLNDSMSPDMLTYKTLLEGLCREGRVDEAFEILEEFRKKDSFMNEKTYKNLLDGLHYVS